MDAARQRPPGEPPAPPRTRSLPPDDRRTAILPPVRDAAPRQWRDPIDVVKADPSDNVYLATAVAGGARWVVTGNTRHLTPLDGYAGLRVVEPAAFLAELIAERDE